MALAFAGIAGGGWLWLLTVPLLATWGLCVNGALQAPIDKRFTGFNITGVRARVLAALLIYLGPLFRGWERIKWRVKEMRAQAQIGLIDTDQHARSAGGNAPSISLIGAKPVQRRRCYSAG